MSLRLQAKKDHPRKDGLVRFGGGGGYRVKKLAVQEVRSTDNGCRMMRISSENQVVFGFPEIRMSPYG